jgi:cyclic pyranopterin phosphate synthase
MPAEGLDWMPGDDLLSDAEVVRLVRILVAEGVRDVRFTGGEPLLRRGLVGIVQEVAALRPRPRISLTTNGLGLTRLAASLCEAGLDRVNVSLDTLRPDRYAAITRRDRFEDVIAGLDAADRAGLRPVKVNAVPLRGVNDDEFVSLLRWCIERGYELRFIEQMPLDAQHGWDRKQVITAREILDRLEEQFVLTPEGEQSRGSDPAESYLVDGGPARLGVIGSVTRPFCAACDRLRITADGQVRNCLFASDESDLLGPLRRGVSDAKLVFILRDSTWRKRAGHGIDDPSFIQPARPMSAIGG